MLLDLTRQQALEVKYQGHDIQTGFFKLQDGHVLATGATHLAIMLWLHVKKIISKLF